MSSKVRYIRFLSPRNHTISLFCRQSINNAYEKEVYAYFGKKNESQYKNAFYRRKSELLFVTASLSVSYLSYLSAASF